MECDRVKGVGCHSVRVGGWECEEVKGGGCDCKGSMQGGRLPVMLIHGASLLILLSIQFGG